MPAATSIRARSRWSATSGQPTLAPALGWAETHPRALHLLREEIEAWSRIGVLQPALAPS